jgi:serine protease
MRAALLLAVVVSSIAGADASAERPGRWRGGEIVVRYAPAAKHAAIASIGRDVRAPRTRIVKARAGRVRERIAALRRTPGVVSATRNWVARASFVPDDPGRGKEPGGWQISQWNFLDAISGVNAPVAWDNLIAAGAPGGEGVTIAVVDTGLAYRNYKRFRRSPDITRNIQVGYDFVDNDKIPVDHNGHGTHVASTIAEVADNAFALTGLAYGATLMPVRVLDRLGEGDSAAISSGIRYAAKHGAEIINLSFEFGGSIKKRQIPDIIAALRFARRRGSLVVAASGNASAADVAYPARADDVLSVGAITEHGCQADYSNAGPHLDLSAPGGGADAELFNDEHCFPDDKPGRDVLQMTLDGSVRRFGIPNGYEGTSMAAPHVSATAALIIASGVIGENPTAGEITARLKETADDLGKPGPDPRYGYGKVNAASATAPPVPEPTPTPTPSPEPTLTPSPAPTVTP